MERWEKAIFRRNFFQQPREVCITWFLVNLLIDRLLHKNRGQKIDRNSLFCTFLKFDTQPLLVPFLRAPSRLAQCPLRFQLIPVELMKSEEGRTFLGMLDAISIAWGIVGIGRLTCALYSSMNKVGRLRSQMNALRQVIKDAEMLRTLELLVVKLERPGPLYKAIFGITSKADFDDAVRQIDAFPGMVKAERDGMKKLALLKLDNASKGPRAFMDYLANTSEELIRAGSVKTEADLVEFRKYLDDLEAKGTLTKEARAEAELVAAKNLEKVIAEGVEVTKAAPQIIRTGASIKKGLRVQEIEISKLRKLHPVPKKSEGVGHIADIADSIIKNSLHFFLLR